MLEVAEVNDVKVKIADIKEPHKTRERKDVPWMKMAIQFSH
jgi:hypothetical protein